MNIIQKFRSGSQAPIIMGILNVTPDSFSDGGECNSTGHAVEHALTLLKQGADILDIGGESTRPNAQIVCVEEEINRVVPVIEKIRDSAEYISIDTRNAVTMRAALNAGANIVNDVSGLSHDPDTINVLSDYDDVPVCIMHMKGTPKDMQNAPHYEDVVDDILSFFELSMERCMTHGVDVSRVILDPGIGFGKTLDHNLKILKSIKRFKSLGCPVLIGASRKSFIGTLSGEDDPKQRLAGSLSVAIHAMEQGADILRVHDVKDTCQALHVYRSVSSP